MSVKEFFEGRKLYVVVKGKLKSLSQDTTKPNYYVVKEDTSELQVTVGKIGFHVAITAKKKGYDLSALVGIHDFNLGVALDPKKALRDADAAYGKSLADLNKLVNLYAAERESVKALLEA